jgi:hypothetical protein
MRFENGALRKILSLRRDDVKVGWMKETVRFGSETGKEEKRNSSTKPEGKRIIGGPRRGWDEMLKRVLKKQDGWT